MEILGIGWVLFCSVLEVCRVSGKARESDRSLQVVNSMFDLTAEIGLTVLR